MIDYALGYPLDLANPNVTRPQIGERPLGCEPVVAGAAHPQRRPGCR